MKCSYALPTLLLMFLVSTAGILGTGYLVYRSQEDHCRREEHEEIDTVANLKVGELSRWRHERLGDASVFHGNSAFSALVRRAGERPSDPTAQEELRSWIGRVQAGYGYDQVSLLDAECRESISVPKATHPHSTRTLQEARETLRTGRVTFVDFYPDECTRKVYFRIFVPIFDVAAGGRPLGVLRFRIDPADYIEPLLRRWPAPNETAETLLVRREGNEAVFLNPLRFPNSAPLAMRVPLDKTDLPAVKAALGEEGVIEGVDYRGVPVLAVVRAVPDSPWFLVAKMDAAEAYEPMRERVWRMALFVAVLLLATAAMAGLLWRHRHAALYRQKYEAEAKYRKLIESSQDAILTMDPQGRISYWNPAAESIFGYPAKEAIGRNLHDLLVPHRYLAAHRAALPEFVRTGCGGAVGKTLELEARRKDGQEVSVALSLSAVSLNGAWHAVGILRDITEKKRADDELLHAKAELQEYAAVLESSNQALEEFNRLAESATRAKSEFLANMSHEIRTPMTAILGYTDILADSLEHPEHQEAVNIIKRNGQHLLGLINDILDLSKVEAGEMPIDWSRCSPFELVADVASLMRVRAAAKHLKLEVDMAGALPQTIFTDPLRLRQVLVNLVGNAIKFTDQGEIRVVVRLANNAGRPRLQFDVIDTGIGMNAEQIGRLFQAFTQVDNSSARRFGGTGLGLCISKRLTVAMGGTIEVHSTPGRGSTFSLTIDPGPLDGIPMVQNTQEALRNLPSTATLAASDKIELHGRVLLAEDGADNQRLITFLLKKAGSEVVAAENGQIAYDEALAALARGTPFDVILMDVQMPVMDGYTATRKLRERGYTGPIIALTAHAMAEDRQKCLDAGCDDYATKPIDQQKLLATIAQWSARGGTSDDTSIAPAKESVSV